MLARIILLPQNAGMGFLTLLKTTVDRLWRTCLTLLILACLTASPLRASDCVKTVFNTYCLGGETAANLAHLPTPPEPVIDSETETFVFEDEGKTHELVSRDGLTTIIVRRETPGGWINFTAWKTRLVRLYGRGEDLSSFPRYAASRSSRLNAINAGRGHAEFRWVETGYTIRLVWDNADYIALRYELNDNPDQQLDNTEGL